MTEERLLCRLEDIPEGDSKGFAVDADSGYADILIVRTRRGVYAYRNRCPHTGAPMEWLPDQFLNSTGSLILCGIHGAQFRIEDGYCVLGPCARRSLERVALELREGWIVSPEGVPRRN